MDFDAMPGGNADLDPYARYERISDGTDMLGSGTYGVVYKVRCRKTRKEFALKKMKLQDNEEGMSATAIREVSILKELPHPNIIKLYDIYCSPNKVNLVFELADFDLKKFMNSKYVPKSGFTTEMVTDFLHQLCTGVEFCHRNRILHRDLKPQNLLVNIGSGKPILQIADFGLARTFTLPFPQLTHEVVTVWYRAPEILMGYEIYSIGVDMWAVGCILAELVTSKALFMGDCEIGTLFKIFQKCGTPNEANWPGITNMPTWCPDFPKWPKCAWESCRALMKILGVEGCDLLDKLLTYLPRARMSAHGCLRHEFFREWRHQNGLNEENACNKSQPIPMECDNAPFKKKRQDRPSL